MAGCLGRVLVGGKDCGAGFALGARLVVTADHVVRGRKDKPLVYVPAGGEAVGVERVQRDAVRDAAVLWLMNEVEFLPTSVTVRGAGWRVESPPTAGNDPQLHGTVTTARMTIQNARGQPVEVVQLQVDEQLGDFGGYSGSAVLDAGGRAVVALLVEQKPLRTPVAPGERRAASNVLYAVPIGDVVTANDLSVQAPTPRIPEAMGGEQVTGHVFISYVREDSYQVDRLQGALQSAGIPVWRDTVDLWPGEDWRLKIRRAISENALVFIACFSNAGLTRGKSYQNEELAVAIEQLRLRSPDDPWLIPVRFDECEIPDRDIGGGRTLASIQRVDLFGDKFDASAARLIRAVMRILGRHYETPPDRPLNENRPAPVAPGGVMQPSAAESRPVPAPELKPEATAAPPLLYSPDKVTEPAPVDGDEALSYTIRAFLRDMTRVIEEIELSAKPAVITRRGQPVVIVTPASRPGKIAEPASVDGDEAPSYTIRALLRDMTRVIEEIELSGKPAVITRRGQPVVIITPLRPGGSTKGESS